MAMVPPTPFRALTPSAGCRRGSGHASLNPCRPRPSGKNNKKARTLACGPAFFSCARDGRPPGPRPLAGLVFDAPGPALYFFGSVGRARLYFTYAAVHRGG